MGQRSIRVALLFLLSLVWVSLACAAEHKKHPAAAKKIVVTPGDIQWKPGPSAIPGSQLAVLEGDPAKRGFFAMRLKLPAGTRIGAHLHDDVERVTVISGTMKLAMGNSQQNPTVLPAGSYFSFPPKTVHNAWVEEETVVQIATEGPWTMKPVKQVTENLTGTME